MGRKRNVKAAKDGPELVVTNPMMANLINILIVIFCVATVGIYAYNVYTFFSLDVPHWEAFAWSAAQFPLFMGPVFVVPMLRKDIICIYAMGPPDGSKTGATSKLLALEDV